MFSLYDIHLIGLIFFNRHEIRAPHLGRLRFRAQLQLFSCTRFLHVNTGDLHRSLHAAGIRLKECVKVAAESPE